MSEPKLLVEHFFRHEYGRLTGLLVKRLGVQHLELVEDVRLLRNCSVKALSGVVGALTGAALIKEPDKNNGEKISDVTSIGDSAEPVSPVVELLCRR